MLKEPIGILDMGIEGVAVLETLTKNFPNENFVYTNDFIHFPYEGYKKEEVLSFVNEKVELLNTYNPKFIIIVSDTIFDICHEEFKNKEEIIFSVPSIIQFINSKYSYKSLLLLARKSIIEANLYQKFFKYSQLTSLASDTIESILNKGNVKISETFEEIENISLLMQKKEIDLIIPSAPFLTALKTEFLEYFPDTVVIDSGDAISEVIRNKISSEKNKGKTIIITTDTKKEFKQKTKWLNLKYRYKQIMPLINENQISIDKMIEKSIKE